MHESKPYKEGEREPWKSRGLVLRCDDDTWDKITSWVNGMPGVYLVFSKTSNLKIYLEERGW